MDDLVARVIQADGVLEVDTENDERVYEQLVAAAKTASNLPFGKQLRLRHTGDWRSSLREIYFDEDFAVRFSTQPVPIPHRVAAYHPVVAAYRADRDRHEVSTAALGRASRILQALATEAVRRGYQVKAPEKSRSYYDGKAFSSPKDGHLQIVISTFSYPLRIRERSDKGPALPYGRQRDRLPRWQRARQTEFMPTGELRITIDDGYSRDGRQAEFRDTKRRSLEDRLPDVLRELEIRAAEDDWRRQQEQRREEERRQRWQQAMEQARHDFRQAHLVQELHDQLDQWRLSRELDGYLTAVEASIAGMSDEQEQAAANEWLTWARRYQRSIDPLARPLSMPRTPKPSPTDLEPFLHGWSPYGPRGW